MILLRKTTIYDAPWKILFSALFLSFIGLIALNSISHQNTTIIQNPFYKQLFFLFIAFCTFSISFIIHKYIIHKYAFIIYGLGIFIVILTFFGS